MRVVIRAGEARLRDILRDGLWQDKGKELNVCIGIKGLPACLDDPFANVTDDLTISPLETKTREQRATHVPRRFRNIRRDHQT